MTEKAQAFNVIGSQKDIGTDIENVKNQLDYLEQYQLQILEKSKALNSFNVKWHGPKEGEPIYKEIDRWIRCYNQLGEHLKCKNIVEEQIKRLQTAWSVLTFQKPTSLKEDHIKGFQKFAYTVFPFYRIAFHKRKSKLIKRQILFFSKATASLKTLAFKIEAFYMDGV
ncbi:MAG: hypothetical protein ACJA0Q_002099 [Saprospiraceae bacterium]|jgi:hypothetical protein